LTGLLALTGCEEEPPAAVTGKAAITLTLSDFSYAFRDGRHTYSHRREFRETGGLGVTITRGKVCVRNGAECSDALVNYRIEASQSLVQKRHFVATPDAQDRITLHYWAKDDAGNKFEFEKTLRTDGETIIVE
jgi:hypothetical protein